MLKSKRQSPPSLDEMTDPWSAWHEEELPAVIRALDPKGRLDSRGMEIAQRRVRAMPIRFAWELAYYRSAPLLRQVRSRLRAVAKASGDLTEAISALDFYSQRELLTALPHDLIDDHGAPFGLGESECWRAHVLLRFAERLGHYSKAAAGAVGVERGKNPPVGSIKPAAWIVGETIALWEAVSAPGDETRKATATLLGWKPSTSEGQMQALAPTLYALCRGPSDRPTPPFDYFIRSRVGAWRASVGSALR